MNVEGPNFFIVGAPKCGTTAIYSYLENHPEVFFPLGVKEPHYYNTDMIGFRWFHHRADYLRLFSAQQAVRAKVRAEASVQYLYSVKAAENIANDYPQARILICLREPSSFIRSYHNQLFLNGDEDLEELDAAWNASGKLRTIAREPRMLDYKSVGLFTEQIERYRSFFPDDQIRILMLEAFSAEPREHYLALLNWLGLSDDGRVNFPRVHTASRSRSIWVKHFLRSPPSWLVHFFGTIKRRLGLKSFGFARLVAKANRRKGYNTKQVDRSVEKKISDYFAQDQFALAIYKDIFLKPHYDHPTRGK